MESNPEQLTCISIIICDDIYRDERTKKLVIIGTFNNLTTPSFPCAHRRMRVLFTLTNGKGDYDVHLSIEHEESGSKLIDLGGPMRITDPLAISDIDIEIENLVFANPGKYWVVLRADGRIIQQRPFIVTKLPGEGSHG